MTKSLTKAIVAPTKLKVDDKIVTDPKVLANEFNHIFINKVKEIRQKVTDVPSIDPIERLREFLNGKNLPEFRLQNIDIEQLRKIMKKKMKSKRGHGYDFIDSYSLKLAFPHIEEVLLHLVNLSISSSRFAKPWKIQLVVPLHKKKDKLILPRFPYQ